MFENSNDAFAIILNSVFVISFFLFFIVYFFNMIKAIILSDFKIKEAFKVAYKEEHLYHPKRFVERVIYELKPKTFKQKRVIRLVNLLFTKSLFYLALGIFFINGSLILELIIILLMIVSTIVLFKHVDKTLED